MEGSVQEMVKLIFSQWQAMLTNSQHDHYYIISNSLPLRENGQNPFDTESSKCAQILIFPFPDEIHREYEYTSSQFDTPIRSNTAK